MLRHKALEKQAVVGRLLSYPLRHPLRALVAAGGTMAAVGKATQAMQGFNPAVHRQQLGMEP